MIHGPARFGLGAPYFILGGWGTAVKAKPKGPKVSRPTGCLLQVQISEDRMEARFGEMPEDFYERNGSKLTERWLRDELAAHGLDSKRFSPYIKDVMKSISKEEDLTEVQVAEGDPPYPPSRPYIHPSYKDIKLKNVDPDEEVSVLQMQQRSTVKPGDLVAEIKFEQKGRPGTDVLGKPNKDYKVEKPRVEMGEGIEEKRPGKFYATIEGAPVIKRRMVMVSQVLRIRGDVNLKSGIIKFDGPVKVAGNVDSGGVINCTGDLMVAGSIQSAKIKVGGSLYVGDGVTTGELGYVRVKHDVRAGFIENTKLRCGGNLKVEKSLVNCDAVIGGVIDIKDRQQGVIAGGNVSCRSNIRTTNLGFKHGAITILSVGINMLAEDSVRIREARLASLKEKSDEIRGNLRELLKRREKNKANDEKKEEYQLGLQRLRTIMEKMEEHLLNAQARLSYDHDVKILVREQIHPNLQINLGGKPVIVANNMASIAIVGKRGKQPRIMPLEELKVTNKEMGFVA